METDEQPGSGRSEGGGGKALLQEILFLLALKLDFRWNQGQKSDKETAQEEHRDVRRPVCASVTCGDFFMLSPTPKAGGQESPHPQRHKRGAS